MSRQRSAEESRIQRLKRKMAGLCIECPRPAFPGQARCELHREKHRARAERNRKAWVAETIAIACRCQGCGNIQVAALDPDALLIDAVAQVKCFGCGAYRMAKEPPRSGTRLSGVEKVSA